MSRRNLSAFVLWAAVAACASWSCGVVLGIEDREPDPLLNLPDASSTSPLCDEYCAVVMESCVEDNAVYTSPIACQAACAVLPAGAPGGASNTVQCRLANAEDAAEVEPSGECPVAGPTGQLSGVAECGTHCEAYCTLFTTACPVQYDASGYEDFADCVSRCDLEIPVSSDAYNITLTSGDSVQCRIYHSVVALLDPGQHCSHASGESPCRAGAGGEGQGGTGGQGGGTGGQGGSGGAGGGAAGAGG